MLAAWVVPDFGLGDVVCCDVAVSRAAKGEPSLDLSAPRVLGRTAALLALSEAAIVLVESAGKIQTRMFVGRAHATAPPKTKQASDQRFCPCFSGFS